MEFKIHKIKPKQIIALVLAVIIAFMFIRFFAVVIPRGADDNDVAKGVNYMAQLEKVDGDEAVSVVKAAQKKYNKSKNIEKLQQQIKAGNYKPAFKGILIVGDSVMEAMRLYGVLDNDQVIAKVGAGPSLVEDKIKRIVKIKPDVIILHFGINQMGNKSQVSILTNSYTKRIKLLKKKLPKTQIYIDSIFPVSKKNIKKSPRFKNIGYYNTCLKKLAKELKVGYIDSTSMWSTFKKNYYDGDGIHPKKAFYTEKYLPNILNEVGIDIG